MKHYLKYHFFSFRSLLESSGRSRKSLEVIEEPGLISLIQFRNTSILVEKFTTRYVSVSREIHRVGELSGDLKIMAIQ